LTWVNALLLGPCQADLIMSGEWFEVLIRDHETTERVFEAMQKALVTPPGPTSRTVHSFLEYVTKYLDAVHHHKEEDVLFPLLEQRGLSRQGGPLAVMLGEHEQSRVLLRTLTETGERWLNGDVAAKDEFMAAVAAYTDLLKQHFWKENDVLFPMARRVLSEADAAAVLAGIERVEASAGANTREKYLALADRIIEACDLKDLSYGLERHVIAALLNTLPVELSFVDDDDRVRYFSHELGHKIFPRTRGAIGTPVQNCHPPRSVHLVNQILADFKAGKREVAEFWIDFQEKKIHIRYYPVRNTEGDYLGCLEVVQDVTSIRALEGQRRLLDEAPGDAPSGGHGH
jgi:DUF438 domain-containing protein